MNGEATMKANDSLRHLLYIGLLEVGTDEIREWMHDIVDAYMDEWRSTEGKYRAGTRERGLRIRR